MGDDESKYLAEERAKLVAKLRRYERDVSEGRDVAVLHEELLPEVAHHFGQAPAQYFDRKGALPYVKNGAVPWPVTKRGSTDLTVLRVAVSLGIAWLAYIGFSLPTGLAVPGAPLFKSLLVVIVFGLTYAEFFPLVANWSRFAPRDAEQRHEDFREYQEIREALVEANINDEEHAAREAAEARRQRLEGH